MADETALHRRIRLLYAGQSRAAVRFRYGLILFDLASVLYFIVAASLPVTPLMDGVNAVLGLVILADLAARLWIEPNSARLLRRIDTLADIIVLASLLIAPFVADDITVLSILRGLRLLHSYRLVRDLRRESVFFRQHEQAVLAGVNLFVFIFVTTSLAFALFFDPHSGPEAYIDALYFTVATLTTTGYGDITLGTSFGKLFSVLVMVVGVALFVQLARAIFQPAKVAYACPTCGLNRHEPDAVHCKHCGEALVIPTAGNPD